MKSNVDGLYLLQDGTHADPSDVSADEKGVLRNKNGMAVCLYEDGSPQTIGEDAKRNMNVDAAQVGAKAAAAPIPPPPRKVDDLGRPVVRDAAAAARPAHVPAAGESKPPVNGESKLASMPKAN